MLRGGNRRRSVFRLVCVVTRTDNVVRIKINDMRNCKLPPPCYRFNKVSFADDQPQRLYAYFSNAIALSSTDSNNYSQRYDNF